MSVKHALLGILNEAPKHGYDLKRAFDDKLGDLWSLNVGQIYTTLERLHNEGLVEYDTIEQSDKPDKKVYRITPNGQEAFETWRMSPMKPEPRSLRDELFVKIAFMDSSDAEAILMHIQTQHSAYMAQMMGLTNRKFQIEQEAKLALQKATTPEDKHRVEREKVIKMALLDVAIFHAEADIRWLRQCEVRIKELFFRS
ncbi:MAG: PadR family transcriptional regulator [Anaerolineae bacterium]|nr:PadR family transcriptional regulator [Anaerolineae bacterium]